MSSIPVKSVANKIKCLVIITDRLTRPLTVTYKPLKSISSGFSPSLIEQYIWTHMTSYEHIIEKALCALYASTLKLLKTIYTPCMIFFVIISTLYTYKERDCDVCKP